MKELGLQELLRYALSGGIGIAVLLLTYPKVAHSVGCMEGSREVTLVLGSVLVVGTLIYNLHRALLFPIFLRVVIVLTTRPWKLTRSSLKFYQPSATELDRDHWRWELAEAARRRWDEWGAQTHSLYCAAWAILAALALGRVFGTPDPRALLIFPGLFVFTLVAAGVNNYRLLYSIDAERKRGC
jgi:hypothetical protein